MRVTRLELKRVERHLCELSVGGECTLTPILPDWSRFRDGVWMLSLISRAQGHELKPDAEKICFVFSKFI